MSQPKRLSRSNTFVKNLSNGIHETVIHFCKYFCNGIHPRNLDHSGFLILGERLGGPGTVGPIRSQVTFKTSQSERTRGRTGFQAGLDKWHLFFISKQNEEEENGGGNDHSLRVALKIIRFFWEFFPTWRGGGVLSIPKLYYYPKYSPKIIQNSPKWPQKNW